MEALWIRAEHLEVMADRLSSVVLLPLAGNGCCQSKSATATNLIFPTGCRERQQRVYSVEKLLIILGGKSICDVTNLKI